MQKLIFVSLALLLTIKTLAQTWNNNSQTYYISKIDTTFVPFQNTVNSCSIINKKYFSWSWSGIFIYDDLEFINKNEIYSQTYGRFLYKASNDTMYALRVKTFQFVKRYFYFENDSLKEDYVNIANNYNKMWMGNYYINVNFKDSNNLKIINRQEQTIDQETFTFENNDWNNKWFYLFLNGSYSTFSDSSFIPNFKLQHLESNSLMFSFALQDSLGNLPTLYSYKISYIDSTFQVSQVAKFENFPLINMYEYPEIPDRFFFNDITYTPNLDTIIISVINNKSDSVYLPIGQNGYTINPTTRGHYVFTLNEPNSIKENTHNNHIQLFPNPTTDKQTIILSNPDKKLVTIKLFDYTGKLIRKVYQNNANTDKVKIDIDISNLTSSMYYYQISIGDKTTYLKTIKQ